MQTSYLDSKDFNHTELMDPGLATVSLTNVIVKKIESADNVVNASSVMCRTRSTVRA